MSVSACSCRGILVGGRTNGQGLLLVGVLIVPLRVLGDELLHLVAHKFVDLVRGVSGSFRSVNCFLFSTQLVVLSCANVLSILLAATMLLF